MAINQHEIVLVNLDPTTGSEIMKTRPCVIISPEEMNKYLNTIVTVNLKILMMEKRQLNKILTEMFPWKKAFCVFTRVNFNYLKKTGFSLAWKSSKKNVSNLNQIIVIGSGKDNENIRGEYFIGNILNVNTCEEIKSFYNQGNVFHNKLANFIRIEQGIPQSTFYKGYLDINNKYKINYEHDSRLVIEFDNTAMEEGEITEVFKTTANPAFFIPKR